MTEPGLLDTAEELLRQDDWESIRRDGTSALQLAFEGDHGQWTCFLHTLEDERQLVFYSRCPVTVGPERLGAAAEYLTRANSGLLIGCFELDYFDGRIRFRTSVDLGEDELGLGLLRGLAYPNVLAMDAYLPGLVAVLGGADPVTALAVVEGHNDLSDLDGP